MVTPSGDTGDDLDKASITFYIKLLEEKEKEPGGEAVEYMDTKESVNRFCKSVKRTVCCSSGYHSL